MMGRLITLVVLLMAALVVGRAAVAQTNLLTVEPLPQQAAATGDGCADVDLPGCRTFAPGTGYGYTTRYYRHSLTDLAFVMERAESQPQYWNHLSRVACSTFVAQVARLHPIVAPLFEGCGGAAMALAHDSDFKVVACTNDMFTDAGYMLVTDITGTSFGVHNRTCYVGEQVVTYKGEVLFSLTCLNVEARKKTRSAPVVAQTPAVSSACPAGWSLTAYEFYRQGLPADLGDKADQLIAAATRRDSHNATHAPAYEPDDVSRTIGDDLIARVTPADVEVDVEVYFRDPVTNKVVRHVGTIHVVSGFGTIQFPEDPHPWIIETVWPHRNSSPTVSGGERRLWAFLDSRRNEWPYKTCSEPEVGILPGGPTS